MLEKQAAIAVVGAGAIGGITAGMAKKNGYNVEIVCKYPDLAQKIKSEGLHLFGQVGDHHVSMPAVAEIAQLSGPKDIVFLATKATDMLAAADQLLPFLNENSVVVSMQNGICEDALGDVLGRKRTIGCVVGWGATMHNPGELEMTSPGEFVVGNIDNQPDPRLEGIKAILESVVPVDISSNILGSLYAKLIVNSCITSLGAVCGLYMGDMLKRKKIRNIFIEIMFEAMAVASAMGLHVEVMAGKLDYYKFLGGTGFFKNMKRHLFIRIIGAKYRRLKSSSLQSLERGKPTEIDYLNGYIADKGRQHNTPTPVNDTIIRFIKEIEVGKRDISVSNFDNRFFDKF